MKYFHDNNDSGWTGCEPWMALRRVVTSEDYNKLLCKKAEETGDVHRCCLLFRMGAFNLKVVLTAL